VGNSGDVDGDGDLFADILDLTYLVDFIFRSGDAPPPVPVKLTSTKTAPAPTLSI